jgi:signal recognition particle GTPase
VSVIQLSSSCPGAGQKQFGPLLVAFVGIPARGKTVMAHKLARYLNWTGEVAKGKLMITMLISCIYRDPKQNTVNRISKN